MQLALKDWRTYAISAGITALLAVGIYVYGRLASRDDLWKGASLHTRRVLVLPLRDDRAAEATQSAVLSESLATALSQSYDLDARIGRSSERGSDYVLEGDVTTDSARTAIVLRLRPAGQRTTSWTATFWRGNLADPGLATDLATAVAAALHSPPRTSPQRNAGGTP
jgi:hypothetical protein